MQKTISREHYNVLVATLSLAREYRRKMDELVAIALCVTGESDGAGTLDTTGHTADAVMCGYSADDLLKLLDIQVSDEPVQLQPNSSYALVIAI